MRKKKRLKKLLSVLCAASMVVPSYGGMGKVEAAGATLGYWPEPLEISNEYYYRNETLQPYGSCFQIDELKNWSPDNDPDARYNRGSIPLRERWMGPNVNPLASRDAKVYPLAMANARASQAASQGGDGDFVYAFNNFQYVDTYNFWGGSSGEGPVAIPSPEVIDSAHRNGVPATGTIFLPWGDSEYGSHFVREMVEKREDGSYPAADKLIEIAQYYGFDGYMFNTESGSSVAGFKEFLVYLQEHKPDNFTITWYNGSGSLTTGSINSWMQDGDTRITDEWWLDMSGNGYVDSTIQAAQETGVDPWNIHSTWEYWPMSGNAKGGRYQTRLDENGILKCSLGILAPTSSLTSAVSSDDFLNDEDQRLWVGPKYDPSSDYRPENEFCGFANLVADRTPVIGTDFVTNFTTGNGYKFYEDGVVVGKENGWYNRSLTDVLPTWRWIIDSEGQKLSAKVDLDDAWYAGSSLKFYGSMDAGKANHVKLYSSQLTLTSESKFKMIYKTPKEGVNVSLGLCFGDTYADENFKFYPLNITSDGSWSTASIDGFGEDAGKTAIAISLKFEAPDGVADYAINVGQMGFTTDESTPGAVSDVTLDEVIYPTDKIMEARVYWEKAENAFMYRIFRVYDDGRREFVGATPNTAFYLGTLNRDGEEDVCKFEVIPYSENCVKGEATRFTIDWPDVVENGFVDAWDEGPNLALKRPAVASVAATDDGSVHLLVDGVISNSKWCTTASQAYAVIDLGENKTFERWVVWHANCPGAGESPDMNTVNFDLQYAPDDGKPLITGDNAAERDRVRSMTFTVADEVKDNKLDITDRVLAEPVTARYVKLNVTKSDNSAWHAIRIYEFQLFEKGYPGLSNSPSPYPRNVTVKNREGANDTVVVNNVPMKYSSGTYGDHNGVFHEDTGKVRLFDSLDSTEPIAVVKAVQPDEAYKQLSVGIARFSGLELNPEGGRLYYDVLDGSGPEVLSTRRASVYYAPEPGEGREVVKSPDNVTLVRTTAGNQLRKQYAIMTATGLEDGSEIKIFASEDADYPILHSVPARNGVIRLERVPLEVEGGKVYYEVHKQGKVDSERLVKEYEAPMNLAADLTGLKELISKCEAIREEDCTAETWAVFAEKLSAARTVAAGSPTAAEAEAARAELADAYAALRFVSNANAQRLAELCDQFEAAYQEDKYTVSSYQVFKAALDAARAAVEGKNSSAYEIEQLRIALEAAVRQLELIVQITGVTVTPEEQEVEKGGSATFTAVVAGATEEQRPSQRVTWTLSGNTSEETTLEEGVLHVAADETATRLTITATSVEDVNFSGNAVAIVVDGEVGEHVRYSDDAVVIATNGASNTAGPDKLFDRNFTDADTGKWCVSGKDKWVAFDIGKDRDITQLKLYHAGSNNEQPADKINTSAYEFYTLDTSKITVEELLAKTEEERNTLLADNAYWKPLVQRTGNKDNVTTDEFESVAGRIFKLNISKTDDTGWAACVRLYEVELYGEAPKLVSGNAQVLGVKVTTVANEGPEKAFDGDYGTKWCSENCIQAGYALRGGAPEGYPCWRGYKA